MNGQAAIREPQVGDDVRDLIDILTALVKRANATIEVKLPGNATKSVRVLITENAITFDFSQLGVETAGNLNGEPKTITLLGVTGFTSPP